MAQLTDYEKYIRTEELLKLQKSAEALTCHDEMQFQVIHQAHELYMKLIEHELRFGSEATEFYVFLGVLLHPLDGLLTPLAALLLVT